MAAKRKARAPKPDLIFAALADYKRACAVADRAKRALERLEEKVRADEKRAGHQPYYGASLADPFPKLLFRNAYYFGTHSDIKKHVKRYLAESAERFGKKGAAAIMRQRRAVERDLLAMFDYYVADREKGRDAAGLTALHDARNAAYAAVRAAMRRLHATKPTTAKGIVALLQHARTLTDEHGGMFESSGRLWATLAAGVERLAA